MMPPRHAGKRTLALYTPDCIVVSSLLANIPFQILRAFPDRRKPSTASSDVSSNHRDSITSLDMGDSQSCVTSASEAPNAPATGNGDDDPTPVKRRFTYTWSWGRRDKSEGDDARGPTGLRLLHASAQPLVDLIFVHGLRGGSIKTWRKGNNLENFWPQYWLPSEPGFDNVNMYSFGYDSDWASSEPSILDIHAFGQNLLEEMRNSPFLRDSAEVCLVNLESQISMKMKGRC
jgi:hypothetical protein